MSIRCAIFGHKPSWLVGPAISITSGDRDVAQCERCGVDL